LKGEEWKIIKQNH